MWWIFLYLVGVVTYNNWLDKGYERTVYKRDIAKVAVLWPLAILGFEVGMLTFYCLCILRWAFGFVVSLILVFVMVTQVLGEVMGSEYIPGEPEWKWRDNDRVCIWAYGMLTLGNKEIRPDKVANHAFEIQLINLIVIIMGFLIWIQP